MDFKKRKNSIELNETNCVRANQMALDFGNEKCFKDLKLFLAKRTVAEK